MVYFIKRSKVQQANQFDPNARRTKMNLFMNKNQIFSFSVAVLLSHHKQG